MRITTDTVKNIEKFFSSAPIEAGGILGCRNGTICAFFADMDNFNRERYLPDIKKLNAAIENWFKEEIAFAGVIHSHHNDCRQLSAADCEYALRVCVAAGYSVYFPVVTLCCGKVVITAYKVSKNSIGSEKIEIV